MSRILAALAVLLSLVLPEAAYAQAFRAYLSLNGNDANPCTLASPCRLLPRGLAVVADGGEIWMLDSANFNTASVTISKSVSILAIPGAVGSVLAQGGAPAFAISGSGLNVGLRNLRIIPNPTTPGTYGVSMASAGGTLTVEDCHFNGLANDAILVDGTTRIAVRNTVIRGSAAGVHVRNGASGTVSGTKVYNTFTAGLSNVAFWVDSSAASTSTSLSVEDSLASGGTGGFAVYDGGVQGGGSGFMSLTRVTASNLTFGIAASSTTQGAALVIVGSSMITGNDTGIQITNGTVGTLENNIIVANGTNVGGGTLTPLPNPPR